MNTTDAPSTARTTLAKGAAYGAGAGVIASVAMGMYAMVASYLKDTGFFTPLHHIASLFAEPTAMLESMKAAQTEGWWTFFIQHLVLGVLASQARPWAPGR